MKHVTLLALVLGAACTAPDVSKEIEAFSDASSAVYADVAGLIEADTERETRGRRDAAIREGRPFYDLRNTCSAGFLIGGDGENTGSGARALDCSYLFSDHETRAPSIAENAGKLHVLLSEYVGALEALASSKLPGEIQASTTALLSEAGTLITATSNAPPSGWVFDNADNIRALTGFAMRQYKVRVLRRTVQDMQEPFAQAIDTMISYLLAYNQEPMQRIIENIRKTYLLMQNNPGSEVRVKAYEAAVAAYDKAYKASPSLRLLQVLRTHEALAARLASPASSGELLALLNELGALKDLFEI